MWAEMPSGETSMSSAPSAMSWIASCRAPVAAHRDLIKFVLDRPGHDFRYADGFCKDHDGARLDAAAQF